jgi:hypothetical protein
MESLEKETHDYTRVCWGPNQAAIAWNGRPVPDKAELRYGRGFVDDAPGWELWIYETKGSGRKAHKLVMEEQKDGSEIYSTMFSVGNQYVSQECKVIVVIDSQLHNTTMEANDTRWL